MGRDAERYDGRRDSDMTSEMISATLGGVPLEAFGNIQWRIAAGPEPVKEVFEVSEDTGRRLLTGSASDPKTLKIVYPGGRETIFDRLFVLARTPGTRPDTMGILVSDIRWRWSRKLIKRSFNIRRRSGGRRRLGPEGTPIQIAPVADDIDFQPWSLMSAFQAGDGGGGGGGAGSTGTRIRWTPIEALRNVMQELAADEGVTFEFDLDEGAVPQSASFEMVELADPGPEALARLLTYMPGTDLYVDRTGRVKFFNKLSGEESIAVSAATPQYVSGQSPRLIDFSEIRPSRIDVYFTPEIEIRFDTGTTVTDEGRFMQNVLPLPDPNTSIGGKQFVQGTWFPFGDRLYNAWNTPTADAPAPPDGVPQLNDDTINLYWFMDRLHQLYDRLGDFNPFQAWAQRVEAIKAHYRQTYQINRRWMDMMHSIRAYRVGILDPENGTRAPAQAYTDYCIRPNMKTMFRSPIQGALGVNVFGYNSRLSAARAAPALVEILDSDLGILRLNFQTDPFGLTNQIIPSAVDNLPSCDIANLNRPLFWSGARISGGSPAMPQLHSTHQVAVVITAAPAAPNDVRQMYKRTVTPAEIQNVPGIGVGGGSNGPPWQVWVGPQITARFMWSDAYSEVIAAAFSGITGSIGDQLGALLVNQDDVDNVAQAVAKSIYAKFTDRYQGAMSTALNHDIEPRGNLLEVVHGLSAAGLPSTTLTLPAERAPFDPWANLPASTRRIIMREVQP